MVNSTKNSSNDKEKKPKCTRIDLGKIRKETDKTEKAIILEIEKMGYSPGDFLLVKLDLADQAKASQILALQKQYSSIKNQKEALVRTVAIQPAKLHEAVVDAEKLLISNDNIPIYQRAGILVYIATIPTSPQEGGAATLMIKEMNQLLLTTFLAHNINFITLNSKGETKPINCPENIARYMMAQPEYKFRVLKGIINAPTLRRDNSILDKPGYDKQSGLLFIPDDCTFNQVPEHPSKENAENALNELLFILRGFPFADKVSLSVALAAILTATIRQSIRTAPLFAFTAPTPASGKTLLADIVSLIATGKSNSVIPQADSEAEEKKRILGLLNEGSQIICIDNVDRGFGSAALCSILTQTDYKDRILGLNETKSVPTSATFLVTGNNLTFVGDITTRALLCTIDPKVEHPEERSFDTDLRSYIPKNRADLISCCLTILRAYHVAGSPKQNIKPFARFEEWSGLVRSALVWLGLDDPCESRKGIEQNDPTRLLLASLLSSWYEIFGEEGKKIKEVIAVTKHIDSGDEQGEKLKESLLELAGDRKGEINSSTLANKLSSFKGRIEKGYFLEKVGTHQGTTLWSVKKIKEENNP